MQESFLRLYSSRSFHIDTQESSGRISESSLLSNSKLYFRGLWSKHTRYLFLFHWSLSTNASLNLNLSMCRSSIVTLHHTKQLMSPGLQFTNQGRFPPFPTESTAFLFFSCAHHGVKDSSILPLTKLRGSHRHVWHSRCCA